MSKVERLIVEDTPRPVQKFEGSHEIEFVLENVVFPPGYEIVPPPESYNPVRKALLESYTRKDTEQTPVYEIPDKRTTLEEIGVTKEQVDEDRDKVESGLNLKEGDIDYVETLLGEDDAELTVQQSKERRVVKLLLQVKNGTPQQRKIALRDLTQNARNLGAEALFNQILPMLMSASLDEHERHLLVKVMDRVLYKLDHLVRPFVQQILVVTEPLLVDEDYVARQEGREIISNLTKAAGLATMIASVRPHISHADDYVRNTTSKALAVVASTSGIAQMCPFLNAVCASKKSWQARHTGARVVQQIAILCGCGILPHLGKMCEIISPGLSDEQPKVRIVTALALGACAEAAFPYGIEAFDCVLRPLWRGILDHRGKALAAYLKAIGSMIPLMEPDHANYYTREVMLILVREFTTPDEELKRICLRVVKQCVTTEGIDAQYIQEEVLLPFLRNFWVTRMALEKKNCKVLVETTVAIAERVGGRCIIQHIIEGLKNASEPFRRVTMDAISRIVQSLGVADVDTRLEELLIDGCVYSFQEASPEDGNCILNGFGMICTHLKSRVKPYLPQICYFIRWRLNNPSPVLRMEAAELIAKLADVIMICDEETTLSHLSLYCFEFLGEEQADVLGSIIKALKSICKNLSMSKMSPPVKDLLPRLTPILKNRHEKVQENVIKLVGVIAERGAEFCPPREWHRICWELLELLKAQRKSIRRAAILTFGYIAKAIGPHDVLATLLNNLKVQERQLRVCTTVAIGVVAEACGPFTVLPAMMNEYRTPELNVRNGILKAISFLFEYIGNMAKDYIYAVLPLLEDAFTDRDLIHRQTAIGACRHLILGCQGESRSDALIHLLNLMIPNIFESAPHLVLVFFDCMDAFRVSLGPSYLFQYFVLGLFHPARRVREIYWRLYNNLYIGSQHALVMSYPPLHEKREKVKCFRSTYLELVI